uniref:Related to molybdenum cofactor sulfurase n=1 Tax=Melanopsichium pennsylvanicum 4 TaxID=1398559 RepID=A0A077R534_9BASI|nr:related to molybdenum cofactor sulfurase [Melanopsichium pennsylvanicum 4]
MVITLVQAIITASKTSSLSFSDAVEYHRDKQRFISTYPQYPDPSLTRLRKREFSRLSQNGGSVYLDYTGASLYPSSLIKSHSKWLKCCVAGNPHSTSPASLLSTRATEDARNAILEFFDADPADYDVVWTSNATAGFRIVGETYDFRGKRMLIPRDAHNSLNSLARKAQAGGGSFEFIEFDQTWSCSSGVEKQDTISRQAYLDALSQPGSSLSSLKNMEQKQQQQQEQDKGLIFFTGQSNITGVKLDMSLLSIAKDLGWNVGLDAAALAPSTRISLRCYPSVDYMVVSLYKICGYPTGVGALIMKKSMYANMTRKETFFGGNIIGITMDKMEFSLVEGSERFEDGTGNFASMAAVASGLKFASRWMSRYTQRNKILLIHPIQKIFLYVFSFFNQFLVQAETMRITIERS